MATSNYNASKNETTEEPKVDPFKDNWNFDLKYFRMRQFEDDWYVVDTKVEEIPKENGDKSSNDNPSSSNDNPSSSDDITASSNDNAATSNESICKNCNDKKL